MHALNPTLWRTCRALAGDKRIQLLRQIHDRPGRNVAALAESVGIGRADASQELRRIQSRGLLQAERRGVAVIYRLGADPQVRSAAPLVKALETAFAERPPARDSEMATLAFGLAYPRRIALAQALLSGPKSETELSMALRLSAFAVFSHLRVLRDSGWVRREHGRGVLAPPDHPLAKALFRLLPPS